MAAPLQFQGAYYGPNVSLSSAERFDLAVRGLAPKLMESKQRIALKLEAVAAE